MIDRFTKERFEEVLTEYCTIHNLTCTLAGFIDGEYVYDVHIDWRVSIRIRSTVKRDGLAADTSRDSIRTWMHSTATGTMLSKLREAYANRTPGWELRIADKIKTLTGYRHMSGDCPQCKHPMFVYRVKEGDNKDRLFSRCFNTGCGKTFYWLEDTAYGALLPTHPYFMAPPSPPVVGGEPLSPDAEEGLPSDGGRLSDTAECWSHSSGGSPSSRGDEGDYTNTERKMPMSKKKTELDLAEDDEESAAQRRGDELEQAEALVEAESEATEDGDMFSAMSEVEEEEEESNISKVVISTLAERIPNEEQLAAIEAPLDQAICVLAPPGSGKTFLLIRRIKYILDHNVNMANVLAVTFMAKMADELQARFIALMPSMSENPWTKRNICTIHAACKRMLADAGDRRQVPPDEEHWMIKKSIQDAIQGIWPDPEEAPTWKEVLGWIYTAKSHGVEERDMHDYFLRYFPEYAHGVERVRTIFEAFLKQKNWFMFGDMLYDVEIRLRHDIPFRKRFQTLYQYVILDEGQDTSHQSMRILTTLAAPQDRFFIVGDGDQCIVEGEKVYTGRGKIPIQDVVEGDRVLSAAGKGKADWFRVLGTSQKQGIFPIVTIRTSRGYSLRCTINHICFASMNQVSQHTRKDDRVYVYLMYRAGYGHRIGITRNPKHRLLSEHGVAMWLLKSCKSEQEALFYESTLAYRYGIPKLTFVEHNKPGEHSARMNNETLKRFFTNMDTFAGVHQMEKDLGMVLTKHPHILPRNTGDRVVANLTLFYASNDAHLLSIETSSKDVISRVDSWKNGKVGKRLRIQNKDAAAFPPILDKLGVYCVTKAYMTADNLGSSTTPQCMPAGNILPGFSVPVYTQQGVVMDEVVEVSVEQVSCNVYDLQVDRVANYFASGICVHNTLYRFAGATPEANLYDGFADRFPEGVVLKLVTNYRSTQAIVDTCTRLIEHNYNMGGGPYDDGFFKEVKARPDAPEGVPVKFFMLASPEEEAECVAEAIEAAVHEGMPPDHVFIGARTRAQLAFVEPALTKRKIPFLNIAGSSFWDTRHIRHVMAFLQVASNPYDNDSFGQIYNIASRYFTAPWGEQKGKYITHHFLPRTFLAEVQNFNVCDKAVRNYRFPYKYSYRPGCEDIVEYVYAVQAALTQEGISGAIHTIMETGYQKYLVTELGVENDGDGGPLEDIQILSAFAKDFSTVSAFSEYVQAARDQAKKAKDKDWKGNVILSTVHRLKGLERPVVFGIGMVEGERTDPTTGMVIPVGLLPHTFSLTPPPTLGKLPGNSQGRVEDERCIAYVVVSRAQLSCVLTGCAKYQEGQMHPSRFIDEMAL